MDIKFFKGEMVRFSELEQKNGMPNFNFMVFDYSWYDDNPNEIRYHITDGGVKTLIVNSAQLISVQKDVPILDQLMFVLKDISFSLRSVAFMHELQYILTKEELKQHENHNTEMHPNKKEYIH